MNNLLKSAKELDLKKISIQGCDKDYSKSLHKAIEEEKKAWNQEYSDHRYENILNLTADLTVQKRILDQLVENAKRIFIPGCGSVTDLQERICLTFPKVEIVCGDFSEEALDIAKKKFSHPRVEYRYEDSTVLSFGDGTFDAVIAVNSVLSIDTINRKMLKEFHRVLKPDLGKLIACFPTVNCALELAHFIENQNSFQERISIDYGKNTLKMQFKDNVVEQTYYTPIRLKNIVKEAGFQHLKMSYLFLESDHFYEEYKRLYLGALNRENDLCVYENLVVANT